LVGQREELEETWCSAVLPAELIAALPPRRLTERRARLVMAAYARTGWDLLEEPARRAVEVVEEWADGRADVAAMTAAAAAAWLTIGTPRGTPRTFAADVAWRSAEEDYRPNLRVLTYRPLGVPQADANVVLCGLLRCVFGNPFRRRRLPPSVRTANVLDLARTVHEDRAFDRLPVLADALMDEGCEDAILLEHCRSGGSHGRGCWVVDLILGKK
jgi:hypothetical protein